MNKWFAELMHMHMMYDAILEKKANNKWKNKNDERDDVDKGVQRCRQVTS